MRKGNGEIKKLGTLFDKYKKTLKAPQGAIIECFCEIISELMHIEIPKEQITYSVHNKILSVRARGPIKSEIKLRKKEILNHLKGRLGAQNAPEDIL